MSAIDEKYKSLGGENGFLGAPMIAEANCPDNIGRYRHYQKGSIYWHPNTGAHEMHGDIYAKYAALGWERSLLGYPTTDERATPDGAGRYNHFECGSIYWHPDTGAYEIHGAIRDKYEALGWEKSFLGYPTTDETPTPDGVGCFNHFQGGSIYWHPDTGAHEMHGDIYAKYAELGWERSVLGYPTTDETPTPDGVGRYNHFECGSIYWHPDTGAYEIHGAIRDKYEALGWEKSFLGYPTTDETPTPDGVGRFNHFQGGSIYWHPDTGAYEIHGDIYDKYAELGWERSILGYPITDETPTPDGVGRFNHFQGGSVYWHPDTGAHEIHGAIYNKYAELGWETSFLGYPTTDETPTPDGVGRFNHFQGGSIYWHPDTGAHEVHGEIRDLWDQNGWELRAGYPLTDETPMGPLNLGRYNRFQHASIGWTPETGTWFDYTAGEEGRFSGAIMAYQDSDFRGRSERFSLSNEKPYVFKKELEEAKLHDKISSFMAEGFTEKCGIYFFQHSDDNGKYLKVTGKKGGAKLEVKSVGGFMNDRTSLIMAVNHGVLSLRITNNEIRRIVKDAMSGYNMGPVKLEDSAPKVAMAPWCRCIKVTFSGSIEITDPIPDPKVKIHIYFRPYVIGPKGILMRYIRYHAHAESIFGIANATILNKVKEFFNRNIAKIENVINKNIADSLENLPTLPTPPTLSKFSPPIEKKLGIRRINIIPEGFEIVLLDALPMGLSGTFPSIGPIEGICVERPEGKIIEDVF